MAILEPSGANERVCSDVADPTYLGLTRACPKVRYKHGASGVCIRTSRGPKMYNYSTFSSSMTTMSSEQSGSDAHTALARKGSRDDAATLPPTPPPGKSERAPFSYQFLGEEKEMVEARRKFITILFQRTMLVVVSILLVFSVYWAAMQRLPARSLQGWIVVSADIAFA